MGEVWCPWGCTVLWKASEGGCPEAWDGVLLGRPPPVPAGLQLCEAAGANLSVSYRPSEPEGV